MCGVVPGALDTLEQRAEPPRGHAGFPRAGGLIEAEGESEWKQNMLPLEMVCVRGSCMVGHSWSQECRRESARNLD